MTHTLKSGVVRDYTGPLKAVKFLEWVRDQDPNETFDWEDSQACAVTAYCRYIDKPIESCWTDHYYYDRGKGKGPEKITMEQACARVFRKFRNASARRSTEKLTITYGDLGDQLELAAKHANLKNGGVEYDES